MMMTLKICGFRVRLSGLGGSDKEECYQEIRIIQFNTSITCSVHPDSGFYWHCNKNLEVFGRYINSAFRMRFIGIGGL